MPQPLPKLFIGQRVRLCAPRPEDSTEMALWTEDGEYLRQVDTDFARPRTSAQAGEQIPFNLPHNAVYFHIRSLAEDQLIGFIVLHSIEWNNGCGTVSLGIGRPEWRGKGYGTEALRLVLNYAFYELNLYRVGLDVIGDNLQAIRAYEKVGFRHEGALRGAVHRDGVRVDRLYMGILAEEYKAI